MKRQAVKAMLGLAVVSVLGMTAPAVSAAETETETVSTELETETEETEAETEAAPDVEVKKDGETIVTLKNESGYVVKEAVVGAAVGDALGVPYEGKERDTYVCENMHPLGWHEKPVGFWSDDTAMILAELDSLRERQGYDAEDVMMKFDRWLHEGAYTPDGKAYGWGRTTARAVSRHRSGTPADICGGGDILDNGAGALMRMLPYALLNSPDRLEIVDAAGSLTAQPPDQHRHLPSLLVLRRRAPSGAQARRGA